MLKIADLDLVITDVCVRRCGMDARVGGFACRGGRMFMFLCCLGCM